MQAMNVAGSYCVDVYATARSDPPCDLIAADGKCLTVSFLPVPLRQGSQFRDCGPALGFSCLRLRSVGVVLIRRLGLNGQLSIAVGSVPFERGRWAGAESGRALTVPDGRPLASIITTCKGRLHHLRRTLSSMLRQRCDFPYELIVVDFGCPQGTSHWCRSLDVCCLLSLKVHDDTEQFHLSRARNCGASAAGGEILAFVDADVFLGERWLEVASRPLLAGVAGLSTIAQGWGASWGRNGTCVVMAELYRAVRGYDEGLRGWGPEDADFSARCVNQAGYVPFNPFLLTPIAHGDEERAEFQKENDIASSDARNREYLAKRSGLVNPLGYGMGEIAIHRGLGDKLPPLAWRKPRRIVPPLRPAVGKTKINRSLITS
jgi:hypothetical protein